MFYTLGVSGCPYIYMLPYVYTLPRGVDTPIYPYISWLQMEIPPRFSLRRFDQLYVDPIRQ